MDLNLILLSVIPSASDIFMWFMDHASYLMVFLLMTVESSFIPFPSEVIVPPAAFLAASGIGAGAGMNVWVILLLATLGALCGAFINYYLSLWIGRPVVYAFADSRIGHALLIDRKKVDKAEAYFDKHGAVSTFIGRLIPAIRQLISIPAGLARMNIGKFAIFTGAGAFIWNGVLVGLGWWLANYAKSQNIVDKQQIFNLVEHYNTYLTIAGYSILGLCVIYILYRAFSTKKSSE